MKKLILFIAFLGLFRATSIAQNNTTLGGISVYHNVGNNITVTQGTMVYITTTTSNAAGAAFYWSAPPSKYVLFHSQTNLQHSSTIKMEFLKPGVYKITSIGMYGIFGGSDYTNVTVLPKLGQKYTLN